MAPEQAEGRGRRPRGRRLLAGADALRVLGRREPEPARHARPRRRGRSAPAPARCAALRPDLPRELSDDGRRLPAAAPRPPPGAGGAGRRDRGLARPARRRPAAPRRRRSACGSAAAAAAAVLGAWLAVGHGVATAVGFQPVSRPGTARAAKEPPDQRSTQPRESHRRPRRGGLQPRLQLRGAAGRTRPQAGQGDGRPQDRRGRPRLRARTSTRSTSPSRTATKLEGYERSLEQELSGYLLEHARRRSYDLLTRPDGRVQDRRAPAPRRVRHPDAAGQAAGPRGRGAEPGRGGPHDGLLGGHASAPPEPPSARAAAAAMVATRAVVSLDDRRYVLDGPQATIGRSKDVECVLRDPNVSRRHAELRRSPPATGRSPTSARPTGSRSTAGASARPGSAPATRSPSARRPSCSTSSSEPASPSWTTTRSQSPSSSASWPSSTSSCSGSRAAR